MDKLDDIAPPKLVNAIRNEVRNTCELQLNDLWIAVSAVREGGAAGGGSSSGNKDIDDVKGALAEARIKIDELTITQNDLAGQLDKRVRSLRKKVGQQLSGERPSVPLGLQEKMETVETVKVRVDGFERDVGQLHSALSLLENRLYDLENRVLRRIETLENRPVGVAPASGAGVVGEPLSTENLLATPTNFSFQVEDLLKVVIKYEGSDLFLKSNALPYTNLQGELVPIGKQPIAPDDCRRLILLALAPAKRKELEEKRSVHQLACWHNTVFRIHAYYERDRLSATVHRMASDVPKLEQFDLGSALDDLLNLDPGLLLVSIPNDAVRQRFMAGAASRLSRHRIRIFTLDQNIEFEIGDGEALVTQQELGTDVVDASSGLQAIKMLSPDVVLVNCPLEAKNWQQVFDLCSRSFFVVACDSHRIVDCLETIHQAFAGERRKWVTELLSKQLKGAVAIHSLPGKDLNSNQMVTATELLHNTEETEEFLKEGHYRLLEPVMERGQRGMHTFRISYAKLADLGLISAPRTFVTQEMPAIREGAPRPGRSIAAVEASVDLDDLSSILEPEKALPSAEVPPPAPVAPVAVAPAPVRSGPPVGVTRPNPKQPPSQSPKPATGVPGPQTPAAANPAAAGAGSGQSTPASTPASGTEGDDLMGWL